MWARVKLYRRLLWHGWWKPIEAGIFLIGLYDTLVGEFLQDWPRVGTLFPQIHWWGWLILLLIVILFAFLEGAYHLSLKSQNVRASEDKIKEMEARIQFIEKAYSTLSDTVREVKKANEKVSIPPATSPTYGLIPIRVPIKQGEVLIAGRISGRTFEGKLLASIVSALRETMQVSVILNGNEAVPTLSIPEGLTGVFEDVLNVMNVDIEGYALSVRVKTIIGQVEELTSPVNVPLFIQLAQDFHKEDS